VFVPVAYETRGGRAQEMRKDQRCTVCLEKNGVRDEVWFGTYHPDRNDCQGPPPEPQEPKKKRRSKDETRNQRIILLPRTPANPTKPSPREKAGRRALAKDKGCTVRTQPCGNINLFRLSGCCKCSRGFQPVVSGCGVVNGGAVVVFPERREGERDGREERGDGWKR
jgi:hypothetical protein